MNQDQIDRYFQFIFNTSKFTLLVLNQFVQNFTSDNSQIESDYIILQFIFYIDITFNYLIEMLSDQSDEIPSCLFKLKNAYAKYKKSNRMRETNKMIVEEHKKWRKLYEGLIEQLQVNWNKFHGNNIASFEIYKPEEYKQDLFNLSSQKQLYIANCDELLQKLIKEFYTKYKNNFSIQSDKCKQGLLLILQFLNKQEDLNSNFMTFTFSDYYEQLKQDTSILQIQINKKISILQNTDYLSV